MKFNLIEFPSGFFTWSNESLSLVADASDMENTHLQPIDSKNRGFGIRMKSSGELIIFVLDNVIEDAEGEIICWEYKPINGSSTNNRVVVYND